MVKLPPHGYWPGSESIPPGGRVHAGDLTHRLVTVLECPPGRPIGVVGGRVHHGDTGELLVMSEFDPIRNRILPVLTDFNEDIQIWSIQSSRNQLEFFIYVVIENNLVWSWTKTVEFARISGIKHVRPRLTTVCDAAFEGKFSGITPTVGVGNHLVVRNTDAFPVGSLDTYFLLYHLGG